MWSSLCENFIRCDPVIGYCQEIVGRTVHVCTITWNNAVRHARAMWVQKNIRKISQNCWNFSMETLRIRLICLPIKWWLHPKKCALKMPWNTVIWSAVSRRLENARKLQVTERKIRISSQLPWMKALICGSRMLLYRYSLSGEANWSGGSISICVWRVAIQRLRYYPALWSNFMPELRLSHVRSCCKKKSKMPRS